MRPLILGREFLYENELKVYYSKTGECRLGHKEEELIATVDLQDELTLTLKSRACNNHCYKCYWDSSNCQREKGRQTSVRYTI